MKLGFGISTVALTIRELLQSRSRICCCKLLVWILLGIAVIGHTFANTISQLPQLNWPSKRSDWVNVKTDVTPSAVGDGVTDDTLAISNAVEQISSNFWTSPRGVYFPPGTYKITDTIHLNKKVGILLVGHGRDTRIVWAGALGGRMLWCDGSHRSQFVGIVWDGAGVAGVGFDHDSKSNFETAMVHKHEEFRNFTEAGIRIGHDQVLATAEVHYQNCLFKNSGAGIKTLAYNDYDNWIQGCNFLTNGYGVYCNPGNFNIYECHFEGSTNTDIYGPIHACSVRRCTSVGSRMFFDSAFASGKNTIMFENCAVDSWTNTAGAIIFRAGGPITITDCKFTNPPSTNPPLKLSQWDGMVLRVISSGNSFSGSSSFINLGANGEITGVTGRNRFGPITWASQSFFTDIDTTFVPVGAVFDARTDFGAVGNGSSNDTAAIQNCIDAARSAGNGAIAYIPAGSYKITSTLYATGTNYRIGGIGWNSSLRWGGTLGGPLMVVSNARNITIEAIRLDSSLANDTNTIRIRHTTSDACSSVFYDYVHCNTGPSYYGGIEFLGLQAGNVVRVNSLRGDLSMTDCSAANILVNNVGGKIKITNPSQGPKTGYSGFGFAGTWGMTVNDNQDLIVGDVYSEQLKNIWLAVSGDGNTSTTSRITVSGGGKIHTYSNIFLVTSSDLSGRIFVGANAASPDTNGVFVSARFLCSGVATCDLTIAGLGFYGQPSFTMDSAQRLITYANASKQIGTNLELDVAVNLPSGWETSSAAAFDDLAELGSKLVNAFYVTTPYQKWAQLNGLPGNGTGLSAPENSPANDGIPNLLKYALGLSPLASATDGLPTYTINSNVFTFSFTRVRDATDILYSLEVSPDLSPSSWTQLWSSATNPYPVVDPTFLQAIPIDIATEPKGFFRLRITQP